MMTITEVEQDIQAQLLAKRSNSVALKSALWELRAFGVGAITPDYLTNMCPISQQARIHNRINHFIASSGLRVVRMQERHILHAKLLGRIKGKRMPNNTEGVHLGKSNNAQPEVVTVTKRWIQLSTEYAPYQRNAMAALEQYYA